MIICVAGATSNVGKTTLVERLLGRLDGPWGVCKVTVCRPEEDHRCPKGKDDTCGVCSEELDSFVAETDETVLRQQGKDTRRYYDAGAAEVIWVRSRMECLAEAVQTARKMMDRHDGIIFEGNHALSVLEPDLAVMAVGSPPKYKASARKVLDKIDFSGEASDPVLLERILEAANRGKPGPGKAAPE